MPIHDSWLSSERPPDKRDPRPVNAFVCLHRLCEHHTLADLCKHFGTENWYPVYIHSIWIYDAHYPEIDIAAIRRKDDVLIDIGHILHNRPFAIGGNVMNQ